MNETAASWRLFQENPCWKDLEKLAEEIKQESVSDEDRIDTRDLNVALIAESRGVRKGLNELFRRVQDLVEKP